VPTLGGVPEIIVSPVFDEEGFDSGEETSLRIPDTQEISSRIPSIDKHRPTSSWPHTRRMVEQVPRRLPRSTKGRSEVALTCAAISLFFAGRDEGAGDLIVLEGEDTEDLFPNTV
jgi:hypothetical protein